MKLPFKRGQKISYKAINGDIKHGTYVMASSAEGYIVINTGGQYGIPKVIPLSAIDTVVSWKR